MQINALPQFDATINTTGCCPKFNPDGWDGAELHFRDKPFVRATTRSAMYVPLDMGRVFERVHRRIAAADAHDPRNGIVLSRDVSPWQGEHLFAVTGPVPGEEMTTLSGDFLTLAFEGPYSRTHEWHKIMRQLVHDRGSPPGGIWFFYTTCPDCAKAYGENHVIGLAQI